MTAEMITLAVSDRVIDPHLKSGNTSELSVLTKPCGQVATHVYRLQSIQTKPPTNPSNAARRIDPDPMTAPAPPLPDWTAPVRARKMGTASGRTNRTTIHRIAVAIAVRTPTPAAVK